MTKNRLLRLTLTADFVLGLSARADGCFCADYFTAIFLTFLP